MFKINTVYSEALLAGVELAWGCGAGRGWLLGPGQRAKTEEAPPWCPVASLLSQTDRSASSQAQTYSVPQNLCRKDVKNTSPTWKVSQF